MDNSGNIVQNHQGKRCRDCTGGKDLGKMFPSFGVSHVWREKRSSRRITRQDFTDSPAQNGEPECSRRARAPSTFDFARLPHGFPEVCDKFLFGGAGGGNK